MYIYIYIYIYYIYNLRQTSGVRQVAPPDEVAGLMMSDKWC